MSTIETEEVKCMTLIEAGNEWINEWLIPNTVDLETRQKERGMQRIDTVLFKQTKFGQLETCDFIRLENDSWFDLNKLLSDTRDKCKVGCCWELIAVGDVLNTLVIEVKKLAK